jgi:hypothetical protein
MKTRLRYLLVVLLLMAAGLRIIPALAQADERRYFPVTGHYVTGDFLAFYTRNPNAERLYGNPLTEAYTITLPNGAGTQLVQYFERARFELNPGLQAAVRVTLTTLGLSLYQPDPTVTTLSMAPGFPACRTIVETGRQICYAFLDFFDAYGGVTQFGYPISEIEFRDGLMVQYFQRARFEWHPEYPSGERVRLTDLGRLYFTQQLEDASRLVPLPPPTVIPGNLTLNMLLSLRVRAFAAQPVAAPEDMQTIYVSVQSQALQPIAGVQVSVTVRLADGQALPYLLPLTDANGLTSLELPLTNHPHGITEVLVTAIYQDIPSDLQLDGHTRTSYRVWW